MIIEKTLKRLAPMDAYLLRLESDSTHVHTASLLVFRRPDDASVDHVERLLERLGSLPFARMTPFCYRLHRGRRWRNPCWESVDDIAPCDHLQISALPEPGGARELTQHVQRLHSQPLDLTRPLWVCHLIDGLDGGCFALYLKMHHALADGGNAVRLIRTFLSEQPEPLCEAAMLRRRRELLEAPSAPPAPGRRPASSGVLRHVFRALATHCRDAFRRDDPLVVVPYRVPPTPFRCRAGTQRVYAVRSIPLAQLRRLHDRSGATINDIVLAACAEALRRYLVAFGRLPERPLLTSVPVALERAEGHAGEGNDVAGICMALPTHLDGARARLDFVRESMYRGKEFLLGMPKAAIEMYTDLISVPFAITQMAGLGARIPPIWNLVVSNVPGPREQLYLDGAPLVHMYPASVIFDGQGLNITARGCGANLEFGLVGCPEAVPELQQLADFIAEAVDNLERELG